MSAPYPYAGRDLFAEPESYVYAECADPGFLDAWRESREAARRRLAGRAGGAPPEAGASDGGLAATLDRCLDALDRDPPALASVVATLDPYVVKFEVHRRLFAAYGTDGRRLAGAPVAGPAEYVRFAAALAALAEATGSLKPLSALLKLMDALTTWPPERFSPGEAAWLADAVGRERALVAGWEAHADDAR